MNLPNQSETYSGYYCYVLELQDGKYYVGSTKNLSKRLKQHETANSRGFVSQYLPIKNVIVEQLNTTNKQKALDCESNKTIELIKKHGIENVYGGRFIGILENRKKLYRKHVVLKEFKAYRDILLKRNDI